MIYIAYYLGRKKENPETTWLDRVVCFFTGSRYSHAELIYDWSETTKRGRCFSSSPRDGGVRGTTIDFSSGHWEVYKLDSNLDETRVLEFFMPEIGKGYDWLGAIGSAVPIFKNRPRKWFCSEIIMACLHYNKPWKFTPQEMFEMLSERQSKVL
jgi:hypothetical protein